MPYVLIIHEVADYAAWKRVFDGAAAIRKVAGEVSFQVLKFDTDANRIVHFSQWRSLDAGRVIPILAAGKRPVIRAGPGWRNSPAGEKFSP